MDIEIKALSSKAKVSKAHEHDAGLDLTCVRVENCGGFIEYGTGVAMSIPEGYVGLLFPRSSVSNKSLIMANSVGVVDANFQGEIKVRMRRLDLEDFKGYNVGDRIAQLVIVPLATYKLTLVDEFSQDSERGEGGFGSSGN